jgi:uncharacterized protein
MRKRLRKKLRKGEFKEFGCEVHFSLNPELDDPERESFIDAFLIEAMEARGLGFGGGGELDWSGYVSLLGRRGSVSESDRASIDRWLRARPEVVAHEVGPLTDAWYGP